MRKAAHPSLFTIETVTGLRTWTIRLITLLWKFWTLNYW